MWLLNAKDAVLGGKCLLLSFIKSVKEKIPFIDIVICMLCLITYLKNKGLQGT